jgi:nucleoside-diphosphate-sugar epimerase
VGRALLIGGAGFVGAYLARELLERGEEVVVLDGARSYLPGGEQEAARARAWRRKTLLKEATVRAGGPDDGERLRRDVAAIRPDVVVQLANLPVVGVAARDRAGAERAIVGATAKVIAATADLAPDARLVYVSSSMVYGDFVADPQPEDAPLRPREPYGACKLAAEESVRSSGLDWTIVRPSAVYGPGDANGRFLQRLVQAATLGRTLDLTADPAARLDFTWVGDLAAGLAQAALCPAASRRAFNITAGRARSLREAIEIVRGLGHEVEVRAHEAATLHPRRGTLDIARARTTLGYRPTWSLERGLAAYLNAVAADALAA